MSFQKWRDFFLVQLKGNIMSTKETKNLEDLFKHLLQDMLYAENKITKALPKMAKKATDPKLQKGFEKHLKETEDQIEKLKKVFQLLDFKLKREKCEAIEGLLKEGESLMNEAEKGPALDAALIAAAQKVEHYEIASYGTLSAIADKLGHVDAGRILTKILDQEKATDEKLTELSIDIEDKAMVKQAA